MGTFSRRGTLTNELNYNKGGNCWVVFSFGRLGVRCRRGSRLFRVCLLCGIVRCIGGDFHIRRSLYLALVRLLLEIWCFALFLLIRICNTQVYTWQQGAAKNGCFGWEQGKAKRKSSASLFLSYVSLPVLLARAERENGHTPLM